jgi:uncharacterized protein YsxB (DUF464 family)
MRVKFIAYVEEKSDGGWFIKLSDTSKNSDVVCNSLKDFQTNLEDMSAEYGNDIEVVWKKSPHLTPVNYNELETQMSKLKEEYKDEIDKINNNDSEFNPNKGD